MSLLSFDSMKLKGGKRTLKVIFRIGAIVGVIAIGSTLAASINLNSGDPIEFGQGVVQTVACDGDGIDLLPESTFVNSSGTGDYLLTSITVTGISSSCDGKDFIVKAYKNGTNTALPLYRTNGTDAFSEIRVNYYSESSSFVGGGLSGENLVDITNGFKIIFVSNGPPPSVALASAQDVERITIESTKSTSGSLSFINNSILYEADDDFKFGLNDFTIESWAYISSNLTNATIYDTGRQVNEAGGLAFWVESNQLKYRINGCWCNNRVGYDLEVPMIWYDSWHHYALTRTNGILRIFVDGNLVGYGYDTFDNSTTSQNTVDLTRNAPSIGRLDGYESNYYLNGKIDSLRVINGSAKYVSNFTPPQNFANQVGTVLLLDPNGSDAMFLDRSDNHRVPSLSSALPTWSAEHH